MFRVAHQREISASKRKRATKTANVPKSASTKPCLAREHEPTTIFSAHQASERGREKERAPNLTRARVRAGWTFEPQQLGALGGSAHRGMAPAEIIVKVGDVLHPYRRVEVDVLVLCGQPLHGLDEGHEEDAEQHVQIERLGERGEDA